MRIVGPGPGPGAGGSGSDRTACLAFVNCRLSLKTAELNGAK